MYYYIFEPAKIVREGKWQKTVKEKLKDYQISGEYTIPSPARTIEEIIMIGLSKQYSTFVIGGSDSFINKVISTLINIYYKNPSYQIVIGLIPSEKGSLIGENLNMTNLDDICLALQQRYYTKFSIGHLEPNKFFFSPLVINQNENEKFIITTPDYQITTYCYQIIIDSEMNMTLVSKNRSNIFNKLSGLFIDQKYKPSSISKLSSKRFVVRSDDGTKPVYRGGEIIAKTPISVMRIRNLLNIIVKRGNIKVVKNEKGE